MVHTAQSTALGTLSGTGSHVGRRTRAPVLSEAGSHAGEQGGIAHAIINRALDSSHRYGCSSGSCIRNTEPPRHSRRPGSLGVTVSTRRRAECPRSVLSAS